MGWIPYLLRMHWSATSEVWSFPYIKVSSAINNESTLCDVIKVYCTSLHAINCRLLFRDVYIYLLIPCSFNYPSLRNKYVDKWVFHCWPTISVQVKCLWKSKNLWHRCTSLEETSLLFKETAYFTSKAKRFKDLIFRTNVEMLSFRVCVSAGRPCVCTGWSW